MDARLLTEGDLIRVVAWSGDKLPGMFRVERVEVRAATTLALYRGPAYGIAIELSPAGWELRDIDVTLLDGRTVRETELVQVVGAAGWQSEVQSAMRVKDVLRVHCPPPLTDQGVPLRLRLEAVRAEADQLRRQLISAEADAHKERTRGDDYRAKLDATNTNLAQALDRCTRLVREKVDLRKRLNEAIHGWHRDTKHMTRGSSACPCGECSPQAGLPSHGTWNNEPPSLFGPDQPPKPDQRALGDDAVYRSGSNECPCPMCVGARGLQC